MDKTIKTKLQKLCSDNSAVLAVLSGNEYFSFEGKGLKPLMRAVSQMPQSFNGAYVYDKVIGRAAALIMVYAKIKSAHGELMSEGACQIFQKNNIEYSFDKTAEYILNRDASDMCPMEKKCAGIIEPEIAYETFFKILLT